MSFTDGPFADKAPHGARACAGWLTVFGAGLLTLAGCGSEQATTPTADEHWYTLTMAGVRAGHVHNRADQQEEQGRQVVHAHQEMQQSVNRFGQPFETKLAFHSVEATDGE